MTQSLGQLRTAVIVCTRDRPDDLRRSLESIIRARTENCHLVVVDQSRRSASTDVVRGTVGAVGPVSYIRSQRRGLSAARNEGAAVADADLLLFTDDDCEVTEDWVLEWTRVFSADTRLGIGFGRVTTPPFDAHLGFIPNFIPKPGMHTWGMELFARGGTNVGMGANMVMRRTAWAATGGFDELLGAGAVFPAAEDLDMAMGIVRQGYRLVHVWDPPVLHHGFRDRSEASLLGQGYAAGTAAMHVKHFRCRQERSGRLLASEIGRHCTRVLQNAVLGRRPTGYNSLRGFVRGLAVARSFPINRCRGVYVAAGSQETQDEGGVEVPPSALRAGASRAGTPGGMS